MLTKSQIQRVKSLAGKKFRQKYNQFIVEGEKAVNELLQTGYKVLEIYATAEWHNRNAGKLQDIEFIQVKNAELERISNFEQPNHVIAIVDIPAGTMPPEALHQPLGIALDFIQDPGNMGTIIRIADWYDIKHIICSEHCVDIYNPKVINATMGSFARVQVHYVNLEETLAPHKKRLYACTMDGEPVYGLKKLSNPIVIIGNEGRGVSEGLLQLAAHKTGIPRRGSAESLNAAVATAIVVDNMARLIS